MKRDKLIFDRVFHEQSEEFFYERFIFFTSRYVLNS